MPKKSCKSSRGRRTECFTSSFFEPNDMASRANNFSGNRPRVSFKTQARPARANMTRNINFALENHFDDDIAMTVAQNNNGRQVVLRGRNRGITRGRNSPLPHRGMRGGGPPRLRQTMVQEASWYKVIIPYGHKYQKDFVLNNLLSYMAPDTFMPIMYKVIGNDAIFYIDDHKTATKLLNCDRKITTNDGFKLQIRIKSGFPHCEIDEALKERLKVAMSKRYDQEVNALNLTKFHQDTDLVEDYFCALFRPTMLTAVLDIVADHIPSLEALSLDGNKLQNIEKLNVLSKKFSQLKILHLGDNKIREMHQLDAVKELNLVELKLAGNPVCNKYKTRQTDYVSDVRKRFPRLLRLDGVELPRPILFDVVDDGIKLPPSERMFAVNEKAREIASQFLQQYFTIFDAENRQPLLDAYHEQASFSLTVACGHSANKFSKYLPENRNLYRISDPQRKRKLLKQGRLPVVSFISELPRTRHDFNSFTMDINLITETMMLITVTGLFKELDVKEEQIRYFNRTFVIVPEGTGYCLRNEQLHISLPTEQQLKNAFKVPPVAPVHVEATNVSSPSTSTAVPLVPAAAVPAALTEDMKRQMTITLSQQTNMNLEWSLKCLDEVQWNYDNAFLAFQEFFKRGQIPQEAFKK